MKDIHKVIAIVVQDNGFLMVRKKGKEIWTNLGGKPEEGETEEEALLREIKEETGCHAHIIRKLGDIVEKAIFDEGQVKLSFYEVKLHGQIECKDEELAEVKFLPRDYKQKGFKLPATIEEKVIPWCIKEGVLHW
jgi:8-oxo-dGTP diphosphatase